MAAANIIRDRIYALPSECAKTPDCDVDSASYSGLEKKMEDGNVVLHTMTKSSGCSTASSDCIEVFFKEDNNVVFNSIMTKASEFSVPSDCDSLSYQSDE